MRASSQPSGVQRRKFKARELRKLMPLGVAAEETCAAEFSAWVVPPWFRRAREKFAEAEKARPSVPELRWAERWGAEVEFFEAVHSRPAEGFERAASEPAWPQPVGLIAREQSTLPRLELVD